MVAIDSKLSAKLANMSVICAVLVCCIHAQTGGLVEIKNAFVSCLCRIAVPYFFVCSGFLLAGRMHELGWWQRALKKRAYSLLLPYLVWSLLFFVFSVSIKLVANISAGAPLSRNMVTGWHNLRWLGLDPFVYPEMGSLWYVRSLILLVLISPILKLVLLTKFRWVWIVGLFVVNLVFNPDMWLNNLLPPTAISMFSLGIVLRFYPVITNRVVKIVVAFLAVALCVAVWLAEGFANDPSKALIARVAMPFVLFAVWSLIPSDTWPRWIVSCPFGIYLVHGFLAIALGLSLPSIPYPVACVVIVLLSLVIVNLLKIYMPRTSALLFGGR